MSNFDPIMRYLLLPISWIYHIALIIRHKLYDWGILKSKSFDQPVICVGNLALGGTGKTPHLEYLIDLLSEQYRVCVVSRGYGRKTKGFQLGSGTCCADTIGDEPMQYVTKFNDILVAVDENRNEAISLMNTMDRPPEIYLLDDAFQHRSTKAGLNLLLTSYDKLYAEDFLIPAGTLRDIRSASRRADILIVSKSPSGLSQEQKDTVIAKLKPLPHQKVFFSTLQYETLEEANRSAYQIDPENADAVLLFCGIARPEPLKEELERRYRTVDFLAFPDHHPYSQTDLETILQHYQNMEGDHKIIVTTEKDYARLRNSPYICKFESTPLFVQPISVRFFEENVFNKMILSYVQQDNRYS